MEKRWLVFVQGMSGIVTPQIWYVDFPYTDTRVVGEKLLIPQEVEADISPDAVLARVEALRRMKLAAA